MTAVDHDHHTARRDLPARWTGAQLRSMTERTLHDLLVDIQAELVRRDVEILIAALADHLGPHTPDPEVGESLERHGRAVAVLFGTREWGTGHLLADTAEVTFEDGVTEDVELYRLRPRIHDVSAAHRPLGFASEYRVDLLAGTGEFAPVGFPDPCGSGVEPPVRVEVRAL